MAYTLTTYFFELDAVMVQVVLVVEQPIVGGSV